MKRQNWAILLLLLIFYAQVALAARHTSITLDEPLHITSGYACLLTGDYRLVEEHPPLLKMLQAFPLLFAEPHLPDPRAVPGWETGNLIEAAQHVVVAYRPIEPLVFAARVPTMWMGILLAALVVRWATDAFNPFAGLIALTLYVFDPNILAHAGVAATDLGAACAIFAAHFTFQRWLQGPGKHSWQRMVIAAIVLGLALGVKSTVLMVFPIFGLLILIGRPDGNSRQLLKSYLYQALVANGIAFLVLWGLYRFEIGTVQGIPFPVPAASHFLPLLKLQSHMQEGHAAFLMGENYHHGVWTYFPVAFALKTPPLTLALTLFTALQLIVYTLYPSKIRNPTVVWQPKSKIFPFVLFPLLYFATSLASGINIGYRHLLPILPFLYVRVAGTVAELRIANRELRITNYELRIANCELRIANPRAGKSTNPQITNDKSRFTFHASRFTFYTLLFLYSLTTLRLFPWHLAYFNFLAGGPDGGYRYLVDSNLDWGQTWKALHDYLDEEGITEFGLSQYTINDPHAYDLDYTPLPPWPDAPPVLPQRFAPPAGIYAISTTQLQGVVIADAEMYDYFRHLEPKARIGHAMHVYEITPSPPTSWAAQCTYPVFPLPAEVLAEGLGQDHLRLAYFDCSQSWLIPEGNGWYSLSREVLNDTYWGNDILTQARLAYTQKQPGYQPPFAIYEWFDQYVTPPAPSSPIYAAPSAWPPAQAVAEGSPVTLPITVGDKGSDDLQFLGYIVDEYIQGNAGIRTFWYIKHPPTTPFSLMAHLLNDNGQPIAVGDGLGIGLDQLQPGDTLIQYHPFEIPPGTPAGRYWIQVGVYTQPNVQRLAISQSTIPDSDRLIVGQLEVGP
ncbi:MAG: glycosyltransferase family 39 protein [Anaerolineae bacterium]|nr:glycosyltransferase family 39 protein [Anaerolineae bacterium]